MRIHILSDVHLEFGPLNMSHRPDADVVVLAGDIGVGVKGAEWALETFPDVPVVMVSGNHELYGGAHPKTIEQMIAAAAGSNVHVLENEVFEHNNVRFLGATMWTDFALFGPGEIDHAKSVAHSTMNDYRKIRRSDHWSKIRPGYTRDCHLRTRRWLIEQLANPFNGKTVVVTHHSPTPLSLSSYPHIRLDDAAYASDLTPLFTDVDGSFASKPDVWIHGHTHTCVDYTISKTRVVSNQRGYLMRGEWVAGWDELKVVEV